MNGTPGYARLRGHAWSRLHAMFAYALSSPLEIAFDTAKVPAADGWRALHFWLYRAVFARNGSTEDTSLV